MIIRKKIKIGQLHNFLNLSEEEVRIAPKSLKVLTNNGFKKVSFLYKTNKRKLAKVVFSNNSSLVGVYDHKVLTDSGYKTIINLKAGDAVKTKGSETRVLGVYILNKMANCYDLRVPENHNFITNDIVSHNTEIFLAILSALKTPSLVVFNRQQLTHQTMQRAIGRGLDAGIVQGQNILEKNITMATIQSIEKIENIRKYKNLILDETHNTSSKQYQNILKLKHWDRVYGFSATPVNPYKMDLKSAKIIANIGPVIYSADTESLIDKKIIAQPKILFVKVKQPYEIEDFGYKEAEMVGIVYNKYRNKIIRDLALEHEKEKVLVLTKYIAQGEEIAKLLPNVPFICNETKLTERMKLVKEFDESDLNILIASRILDEGIDIKNFRVLIIASAGKSFIKTIQRLGRGLRVAENKDSVIVYDFLDTFHESFHKHSKRRMKDYRAFGYNDITTIGEKDDI